MDKIPAGFQDLLKDQTRAFAFLATLMPDGSPQVTPIWFDYKDGKIYINTAKGRAKDRNMRDHPEVALDILDPGNPYRYIQIRGKVVEITEKGAKEHADQLSRKYTGQDYSHTPGEVRVMYAIQPAVVTTMG